jgi:hypothetical protein
MFKPKAAILESFIVTRRNRDNRDMSVTSRQAASWGNGKTGFDSHQEREISFSCTASRLALKRTRGSNPGSKSGRERTDHQPPPVPWLRMCGATFPLQHIPSWLNCYWSTGTCVRFLKYLSYKVRRKYSHDSRQQHYKAFVENASCLQVSGSENHGMLSEEG